ncbi:MAG TPA: hypothetical protein VF885_00860 [Arthrobacter sp.]
MTQTASPADLQPAISQALGRWASERAEANLSHDLTFGPVRLDAARYVARAIGAPSTPPPTRPVLTVVR